MYGKLKRTWYISRKCLWICQRRMSKTLGNQDYLCPGRISHRMCPTFYSFFKKLRFEHRVVALSAVGVVLADYNNYILLTGADVFEQQQLNSTGKPKWGALQWSLTLNLHRVHRAQVLYVLHKDLLLQMHLVFISFSINRYGYLVNNNKFSNDVY